MIPVNSRQPTYRRAVIPVFLFFAVQFAIAAMIPLLAGRGLVVALAIVYIFSWLIAPFMVAGLAYLCVATLQHGFYWPEFCAGVVTLLLWLGGYLFFGLYQCGVLVL